MRLVNIYMWGRGPEHHYHYKVRKREQKSDDDGFSTSNHCEMIAEMKCIEKSTLILAQG
jgi:hypothetical protein